MATVVKEDVSILGALNANTTIMNVSDSDFVACQATGTFVGTLTFYASNDGVTWYNWAMHASAQSNSTLDASGLTGNSTQAKPTNGIKYFKLQMTAYTSGSATVYTACSRYGK